MARKIFCFFFCFFVSFCFPLFAAQSKDFQKFALKECGSFFGKPVHTFYPNPFSSRRVGEEFKKDFSVLLYQLEEATKRSGPKVLFDLSALLKVYKQVCSASEIKGIALRKVLENYIISLRLYGKLIALDRLREIIKKNHQGKISSELREQSFCACEKSGNLQKQLLKEFQVSRVPDISKSAEEKILKDHRSYVYRSGRKIHVEYLCEKCTPEVGECLHELDELFENVYACACYFHMQQKKREQVKRKRQEDVLELEKRKRTQSCDIHRRKKQKKQRNRRKVLSLPNLIFGNVFATKKKWGLFSFLSSKNSSGEKKGLANSLQGVLRAAEKVSSDDNHSL